MFFSFFSFFLYIQHNKVKELRDLLNDLLRKYVIHPGHQTERGYVVFY